MPLLLFLTAYSFPFGYSVGLSCVIDKDSVDVETQQIFSYYNIDVLNLGRELELEKKWFFMSDTTAVVTYL